MLKILLSLLLSSVAFAQAPVGTIAGTVFDESGGVVLGAAVRVTNFETSLSRELKSGSEGQFSAPSLPTGRYEVRSQIAGFRQTVRETTVAVGSTTTVGWIEGLDVAIEMSKDPIPKLQRNAVHVIHRLCSLSSANEYKPLRSFWSNPPNVPPTLLPIDT